MRNPALRPSGVVGGDFDWDRSRDSIVPMNCDRMVLLLDGRWRNVGPGFAAPDSGGVALADKAPCWG
jgi:hypothetical protein